MWYVFVLLHWWVAWGNSIKEKIHSKTTDSSVDWELDLCPICSCLMLGYHEETKQKIFLHFTTHLAHLELEETSLLFHLLCNFSPCDLRADHSVLFGVLTFLLLNLCTVTGEWLITNCSRKVLIESIFMRLRICFTITFPLVVKKKQEANAAGCPWEPQKHTRKKKNTGWLGVELLLKRTGLHFRRTKNSTEDFSQWTCFCFTP